jgi:hypothetical protein
MLHQSQYSERLVQCVRPSDCERTLNTVITTELENHGSVVLQAFPCHHCHLNPRGIMQLIKQRQDIKDSAWFYSPYVRSFQIGSILGPDNLLYKQSRFCYNVTAAFLWDPRVMENRQIKLSYFDTGSWNRGIANKCMRKFALHTPFPYSSITLWPVSVNENTPNSRIWLYYTTHSYKFLFLVMRHASCRHDVFQIKFMGQIMLIVYRCASCRLYETHIQFLQENMNVTTIVKQKK